MSITESIISGSDGTKINGSINPCKAYPTPIIQSSFGKLNNYDGPTQILTKNDNAEARIKIALFLIPLGMNCTIILVGI